jgi:hypothetical protein
VASQFHLEFLSRPNRPRLLFLELVEAAKEHGKKQEARRKQKDLRTFCPGVFSPN